jgi:hypothetical protein
MTRPDLSTPDSRNAYARELRTVAWPWRVGGLALVVIATALLVSVHNSGASLPRTPLGQAGLVLMAVGWAACGVAIARRTAYHRRRMSEDG